MNSRWLRRCSWALLILLGIAYALWRLSARSESIQVRLTDGSMLRLEGIKYKSKSAALLSQRWIDQGRQWLAEHLGRAWLNDAFAPPDTLVVWVSLRDKQTGKAVPTPPFWSVSAVDSHGCRFGRWIPGWARGCCAELGYGNLWPQPRSRSSPGATVF